MTRRERHALELAYDWLRMLTASPEGAFNALREASAVLGFGGDDARELRRSVAIIARTTWRSSREKADTHRLLRARLALAIHAILRADAGDCGPMMTRCDWCLRAQSHATWCEADDAGIHRLSFTPLWQSAPAAGTATRPLGLKRRP